MSNPLREQFGFNTDLTGYTQWTPTVDGTVEVANVAETYYLNDSGDVTLDVCVLLVMDSDTAAVDLSGLPVAPEGSTVTSNAISLHRVEDNSVISATLELNAPVDADKVTLTTDGTTLVTGGVYVGCGTISYTAA